jgi:hypothetical protein
MHVYQDRIVALQGLAFAPELRNAALPIADQIDACSM